MPTSNSDWQSLYQSFHHSINAPTNSAVIKRCPDDFKVSEDLGFSLKGEGEHLFLYIEKTGLNTADLAQSLAKHAGIKIMDVGFSGLKDKYAVTKQWLSLYLPGAQIELPNIPNAKILQVDRHNKKLRRGVHRRNEFDLMLRECSGSKEDWEVRLTSIKSEGFANYFTEQRFGRGFSNLDMAKRLFMDKQFKVRKSKRALYLSAARSWLFNEVCSNRLKNGTWYKGVAGELFILEGSRSFFESKAGHSEIDRIEQKDIHPSGPLWGKSQDSETRLNQYELSLLGNDNNQVFRAGLEQAGMKLDRRALRALAYDLQWEWLDGTDLRLKFKLQKGSYATALLRELIR